MSLSLYVWPRDMELLARIPPLQGGAIYDIGILNITYANFTSNVATSNVSFMQIQPAFLLTKELPLPFHILPRDMELFCAWILGWWSYL